MVAIRRKYGGWTNPGFEVVIKYPLIQDLRETQETIKQMQKFKLQLGRHYWIIVRAYSECSRNPFRMRMRTTTSPNRRRNTVKHETVMQNLLVIGIAQLKLGNIKGIGEVEPNLRDKPLFKRTQRDCY